MSFRRLFPQLFLTTASLTVALSRIAFADPAPPNAPQPQDRQPQGEQPQAGKPQAGKPRAGKPQAETPQQTFTIPFTSIPRHGGPLVHFRINGQEDVTFLADTGFGGDFIIDTLAAKLDLKARPALGDGGKPINAFGVPLSSVEITKVSLPIVRGTQTGTLDINLTDSPFYIFTQEQMGLEPNPSFQGIFGAPFFHSDALLFDFPGHTMTLSDPGGLSLAQVKALGFGGEGGAVLPLSPCEGASFSVPATVSDGRSSRRVELEVDTGADSSSIPLEATQALYVKFLGTQETAGGTAGERVYGKVELPSLSIGDIRLTNVTVLATDNLATPAATPPKKDLPPHLGMDILKNYRVLIDYPSRLMYIQPVVPEAK